MTATLFTVAPYRLPYFPDGGGAAAAGAMRTCAVEYRAVLDGTVRASIGALALPVKGLGRLPSGGASLFMGNKMDSWLGDIEAAAFQAMRYKWP